ncbi:MAG: hypothetical protein M0P57_08375 [Syntrophales bacterium]|jgi:hypothetical protein|nr:hypothetical protein [Syntrophales bacterium]MDY0044635.1 hypothetical protein [Syntrophales bacterium]
MKKRNTKKTFILYLSVLAVSVCSGCTAWRQLQESYGKLRLNDDVKALFESYVVSPEFEYYISGTDLYPRAIIRMEEDENFAHGLWKRRHFTRKDLQAAVENMRYEAMSIGLRLHGFDIIDNSGKKVGEWYSVMDVSPSITRTKEGYLSISTPRVDIYERPPRINIFHY